MSSEAAPRFSIVSLAAFVLAIASAVAFVRFFDFHEAQYSDLLWLAGVVLWAIAVRSATSRPVSGEPLVRPRDFGFLVVFLPLFAACWLPFYDNWRWAYIGDSWGIFGAGYYFGKLGASDSVLSVHGIDDFYTVLWGVAYNWLVYLVTPSLFWHRVGELVMTCAALATIFTYYTAIVGRGWGAAITIATATNYVFLWMSFISYQRTDSFVFYYLTLLCGLRLWRSPENLRAWMACGLIGGLSLFFTPVVWGCVGAVATVCGLRALFRRQWAFAPVYVIGFVLIGLPVLIEYQWLMKMLGLQAVARDGEGAVIHLGTQYYLHIYRILMESPYYTPIFDLGMNGGILRPPLGMLYFLGVALTVASAIPVVRRKLRVPAVAPGLLALLLFDALLFTMTNKGYGAPSHKRFYNLIPLQIFFALLPFYVVTQLAQAKAWLRALAISGATLSLVVAASLGFAVMSSPPQGMYGSNALDGLIEIRQRYADRDIVFFSPRHEIPEPLRKDSLMNQTYGIADRLSLVAQIAPEEWKAWCQRNAVLCFNLNPDREAGLEMIKALTPIRPIQVLNSSELRCFECAPTEPAR